MTHEIYFEISPFETETVILQKIKTSLPSPSFIRKHACIELVVDKIDVVRTKLSKDQLNSLKYGYNLYLENDISRSDIDNIVRYLSGVPGILKAQYNGIITAPTSYEFPALKSAPENNPNFFIQQHHFISPLGVDSMYGWSTEGGSGAGINIFMSDVEISPDPDISYTQLEDMPYGTHCSDVIGILSAHNNDISCVGIVPDAKIYVEWFGGFEGVYQYGKPGDVVNLSIGYFRDGLYLPWTMSENNVAKIILAAEMGVTTCYAACNDKLNLDETAVNGKYIFNKNHADYSETMGICVGGAMVLNTLDRKRVFNYGSIIDAYAQSITVQSITGHVDGTSFSTPIIAGLIAQIQSICIKRTGNPLSPLKIRELISAPEHGVPGQIDYQNDRAVMPDLRKILTTLNITPANIYPDNYGVSDEALQKARSVVEALFGDDSHVSLAQGVSVQDILAAQDQVKGMKPCKVKIELLELINVAFDISDERNDELLEDNEFISESDAWLMSGQSVQYTPSGVVISGLPSTGIGNVGLVYRKPIYINSEKNDFILSAHFEVLEWSSSDNRVATLGAYIPSVNAIIDAQVTKKFDVGENTTIIENTISDYKVSFDQSFPGFGIENAHKVLIKKLSLRKKLLK
ncbi:toxin Cry1Ac domain D-VI-related protein [Serratia marcescens]